MAIGIVAFAFVALLGLIPNGLNTFREAIDKGNEAAIMQNLNAMVQVTDWSKIDSLDFNSSGEIYYYDEEGRVTDTESVPSADEAVRLRRLYGAKLLVEKCEQPGDQGGATLIHARRIVAVMVNVTQPKAKEIFEGITMPEALGNIPASIDIRSRGFIATHMSSDYTPTASR